MPPVLAGNGFQVTLADGGDLAEAASLVSQLPIVAQGEDRPELRTKAQPGIRTSELPLVAVHYLRIGDTTPEQYGPHDEHALGACVKPILVELRGLEAVVGAGR